MQPMRTLTYEHLTNRMAQQKKKSVLNKAFTAVKSPLLKCLAKSFVSFSGGQSDQGYDSLSKEEERVCSREGDGAALLEEKGHRQPCELSTGSLSPICDLQTPLMQE